jgi:Arc/MetJ-type ribon-helix-helix transcriptional regulator
MSENKPGKEKRVNQFNLMLKDSELELLNENAEEKGFPSKSDYLRELIKKDAADRKPGEQEVFVRKQLAESRQMLNKLNRSIRLFLVVFLIILMIIVVGAGFILLYSS